jgi:hypothetical protein
MMAGTGRAGSSLVAGAIALTGRLSSTKTIQRSGGTTGRLLASTTTKSDSRWSRSVAIQIASLCRGRPADRSNAPPVPVSTRGAQANGAAQGWPDGQLAATVGWVRATSRGAGLPASERREFSAGEATQPGPRLPERPVHTALRVRPGPGLIPRRHQAQPGDRPPRRRPPGGQLL